MSLKLRMNLEDRKQFTVTIRNFLHGKQNTMDALTLCYHLKNTPLFEEEELRIWKALYNVLLDRRSSAKLRGILRRNDLAIRSIEKPEDFPVRDLGRISKLLTL